MKIFDVIVRIVSVLLLSTSVSSAQDFQLLEATISSAQASMTSGEITCRELVELYLDRIEAYDKQGPELNAIQHINPRVLEEADEMDAALEASGPVGPITLHPRSAQGPNRNERHADHIRFGDL